MTHSTPDPSGLPRRIATRVVLVGGTLAFLASFLPLGYASYPANSTYSQGATTNATIPAQDLIAAIQFNLRFPQESSIGGTCVWAFLLWGAPLILAAAAVTFLLKPGWFARVGARIIGLVLILLVLLVLLGTGYTLVSCQFYLYPFFGLQGATHALAYGAGVALFGYLSALMGIIWLTIQRITR
jgi:hypothetical protein